MEQILTPNFITDPSHCLNRRFCISPGSLYLQLVINCLKLMNNSLEKNLSLPDYALNSEVEGLSERVKDHISPVLEYACNSWHNHLNGIRGDTSDVLYVLQYFLEKKFLAWLEVVSALGAVRDAISGLKKLRSRPKQTSWSHSISARCQEN